MRVLNLSLMWNSVGFTTAFRKHTTEYRQLNPGEKYFNQKAQDLCIEMKPDLVFIQIQAGGILTIDTAKVLKENSGCVIEWTGDVRSPIPKWYYDIAPHIDMTCFSNMTDVRQFRKDGFNSEYLEIGFDPEIFKPEGEKLHAKEIVFLGNNYGSDYFPLSRLRIEMVGFLRINYGDRFGVYGNGWTNGQGSFNHSQIEEAKFYRGADIAINLSHFDYERYNSDRILRIMGTGVACLTKDYEGREKDYTDGIDVGVWNDFEELKILLDHYLNNKEERKSLAMAGCKLSHKKFTYDSMIKNILKLVK